MFLYCCFATFTAIKFPKVKHNTKQTRWEIKPLFDCVFTH